MLQTSIVCHPSNYTPPLKISMSLVAEGGFLTICVQAAIFQLSLQTPECWTAGTEPAPLESPDSFADISPKG